MDLRHLAYCRADSPFYEPPGAATGPGFDLADGPLPPGWTRTPNAEWVVLAPPEVPLPVQGWKVHVSGTLDNAARILDLVAASGVQTLSHDAGVEGMYRIRGRSAPHNVYGSPETFWRLADAGHQAAPAEQFEFARSLDRAAAVVGGTPVSTLAFRLSAASSVIAIAAGISSAPGTVMTSWLTPAAFNSATAPSISAS